MITISQSEQALRTATEIGNRLKTPADMLSSAFVSEANPRPSLDAGTALPGLTGSASAAMLLHALDRADPGEGWAAFAHAHLQHALGSELESIGVVSGWSGIALALDWIRSQTGGYAKAHRAVTQAVAKAVNEMLSEPFSIRSSHEYELFHGYAGVYLALDRDEHPATVDRIIDYFEWLFDDVERWRIPNAYDTLQRGSLNILGVSHGAGGVLGVLCRKASTARELALARRLVDCIEGGRVTGAAGTQWGYSLADANAVSANGHLVIRPAWCHGTLGIAAVLCSAGALLDDPRLIDLASAAAETLLHVPFEHWGMTDFGMCHGVAGNALMLQLIGRATRNPAVTHAAAILFERSLAGFEPCLPFGYHTVEHTTRYSDPGIVTGAPGIGLALLSFAGLADGGWLAIFGLGGRAT